MGSYTCRRRTFRLREVALGDAGAADVWKASIRPDGSNTAATSTIHSAMSQSVQASVALQMRQLAEEARRGKNNLESSTVPDNGDQGLDTFLTSRFRLGQNSWEEVIEEAPSVAGSSDIDSLVGYGWPDKMPHKTDKNAVVSSLAQTLANQHQAELKERARGAAAWNVRVAQAHQRRTFLPNHRGAPLRLQLIHTWGNQSVL